MNLNSPTQLAQLFFGGKQKKTVYEPVLNELGCEVIIKSGKNKGQVKLKKVIKEVDYNGLGLNPLEDWKTPTGKISVNEKVLSLIASGHHKFDIYKTNINDAISIAKHMLKIRGLQKELGTYYEGTRKFIDSESLVHPTFNHCATDNAQLSCTKPNVQNIPRSPSRIKEHFCSRYGDDGVLIEFDYKGLEVYICAYISQDIQLLSDLNNKIDLYKINAATVNNVDYDDVTDEQRSKSKTAILAIIYYAQAWTVARDLKISEEEAQVIIDAFYNRYPMVRVWQENAFKQVEASAKLIDEYTKGGFQRHIGSYTTPSGRRLTFKTFDASKRMQSKGINTRFDKPQMANYAISSFAKGDIVMIMVGKVWREALKCRDKLLLINTVHDSLIIDCQKQFATGTCIRIKNMLQSVKEPLKELFGIDFNLDLIVEVKQGKNWLECS